MNGRDANGFKIKAAHTGVDALEYGETVWLLRSLQDVVYGVWPSRHAAIGDGATKLRAVEKEEWLEPVPVPVGTVRMKDIRLISDS